MCAHAKRSTLRDLVRALVHYWADLINLNAESDSLSKRCSALSVHTTYLLAHSLTSIELPQHDHSARRTNNQCGDCNNSFCRKMHLRRMLESNSTNCKVEGETQYSLSSRLRFSDKSSV